MPENIKSYNVKASITINGNTFIDEDATVRLPDRSDFYDYNREIMWQGGGNYWTRNYEASHTVNDVRKATKDPLYYGLSDEQKAVLSKDNSDAGWMQKDNYYYAGITMYPHGKATKEDAEEEEIKRARTLNAHQRDYENRSA